MNMEYSQLMKVTQTLEKTAEFIANLIADLLKKEGGATHGSNMQELLEHMQKGGKTENVLVPESDREYFADLLRGRKVPYTAVDVTDPVSKETNVMFVFRDSDDAKVRVAVDNYKRYLDGQRHELDNSTFLEANEHTGYFTLDNLSAEELTLFRAKSINYNIDFTAMPGEKMGTYKILANNKNYLAKAYAEVLYDTVGPEGQKFLEKMKEQTASRAEFYADAMNKSKGKTPVYIVDAKNPYHIVSLCDGGYSIHRIKIESEELPDGTEQKVAIDARHRRIAEVGPGLVSEIERMKQPVYATPEYIEQETADGTAIVNQELIDEEYRKKLEEAYAKNNENEKPLILRRPKRDQDRHYEPSRDGLRMRQGLSYLSITALQAAAIPGVVIAGKDICYPKAAENSVIEVMKQTEYKDLNALEIAERELTKQGRGYGHLFNCSPGKEYFLCSKEKPKRTYLHITEHGMEFIEDGKVISTAPPRSMQATALVAKFSQKYPECAFLTPQELSDSRLNIIMDSKLKAWEENQALQMLKQLDKDEKEDLLNAAALEPSEAHNSIVRARGAVTATQEAVLEQLKDNSITFHKPTEREKLETITRNAEREIQRKAGRAGRIEKDDKTR